jgi:hypothetical protein
MENGMQTMTRMGVAAALMMLAAGCAEMSNELGTHEQAVSATLDTDKDTYLTSEPIQVSFADMSGAASDWISIAHAGDPDTTYIKFRYTEGAVSGTFSFAALPAGNYEARAYFMDSFQVEARATFTVGTPPVGTALTTDATTYAPGSTVTVNYTGLAGTSTDWVSIALPGSPATSFVRYQYTAGTPDGMVAFAGLANGTYVARSYNHDTYTVEKESAPFVIGSVLSTNKASYTPGESVIVSFQGIPAKPNNWVSIAAAGSSPMTYVAYRYVTTASGSETFANLPAGNYEARIYLNDSYVIHAQSAFTIAAATVADVSTNASTYTQGQPITALYNVSGASDWVAIAAAGSPDNTFLRWSYVANGMTTFNNNLAAGNYEMRLYLNDSFVVADRATFSVTAPMGPPAADVTTTQASYTVGQTVVVNYTSLPGAADWIGISVAGSPDTSYVKYMYTGGVADGQVQFTGLPAGSYEARAYKNDSFVVADRTTFDVTP